jgi:DDE family transposase
MERELWPPLYRLLREVGNDFQQKYVQHPPWVIVAVLLWAALHDRPHSWACRWRNWSTTRRRPARLPAPSTFSRRLPSLAVGRLLSVLEERIRQSQDARLVAFLDGKPLLVGGPSKDPDAGFGRAAGHQGNGYKLHALWGGRAMPEVWEVTALRVSEKVVARDLLARIGGTVCYVLADGNFDANGLFDIAGERGTQLVVPMPDANAGKGHHYQSPYRLRCIALMRGEFGASLYAARGQIERSFGNAGSFAGGLGPLPAWVRRQHRVLSWVWAKLLINGIRILNNQGLAA